MMSAISQDDFPPEFPFPLVGVPGAKVFAAWKKYQSQWCKMGCSAVVVGDTEQIAFHQKRFKYDKRSPRQILALARKHGADQYFAHRLREWPTFLADVSDGEWP